MIFYLTVHNIGAIMRSKKGRAHSKCTVSRLETFYVAVPIWSILWSGYFAFIAKAIRIIIV